MSTPPPWGDGPLVGYVLHRVTVDGERRTEIRNALLGLILASELWEDPRAELRVWEHMIDGTSIADWLGMFAEDRPKELRKRLEGTSHDRRSPSTLQDAAIAAGFDITGNAVSGYVQQQVEERGPADLRSSGRDVLYSWPDGTWAAFRCWAPAEEQESGKLVLARKADMWRQLDRNPFARDTTDEEVEERLGEPVQQSERETNCYMGVHHYEEDGPCLDCGAPSPPHSQERGWQRGTGTAARAGAPGRQPAAPAGSRAAPVASSVPCSDPVTVVVACSYCGKTATVPTTGERCMCPGCHQPVSSLDPSPTVAAGFAAVHGDQRSAPGDWVARCRANPTKPRKQRELAGGQPACERCGKPILAGQTVLKPSDYKGRKRMHGECL